MAGSGRTTVPEDPSGAVGTRCAA